MRASFGISVFNTRLGVQLDDGVPADAAKQIVRSWSDIEPSRDPDSTITAGIDDERNDVTAPDAERLAERLTSAITMRALEAAGGSLFLFHACAIADDAGRTVAFVGPSGRGKTTVARTLGTRHAYVSDETVAIDDTAHDRVLPYRKPLSIIETIGRPKRQRPPSELRLLQLPSAELRLAALVLLDRDDAHTGGASVQRLGLDESIPELVQQTSYLIRMPRPLRRLAALLERTGGAARIRYAEATELDGAIGELFGDASMPQHWAPFAMKSHEASTYAFADVVDAIEVAEGILVLTSSTVQLITGIGPTILRAVADGRDPLRAVVEAFGEPEHGDAASIVRSRIEELRQGGVLHERD